MNRKLRNIWIIDEDDTDMIILKANLIRLDHSANIHHFNTAPEAMDQLLSVKGALPELIFLDISNRKENVFCFLKQWTEQTGIGKGKIFIISNSNLGAEKQRAFSFPDVMGFLSKPVLKDQLDRAFKLHFGITALFG